MQCRLLVILVIQGFLYSWIAGAEIRVLTTEEPPTNYSKGDRIVGFSVDVIQAILRELNETARIEMLPWARAYEIAKRTPNVVAFTVGQSQERINHGFHFIGPLASRKHILWKRKGSLVSLENENQVIQKRWVVAGMRQDWRLKYFARKKARVMEAVDPMKGLRLLMMGRADLWISSDMEAPAVSRRIGAHMKDLEIAYVFKEAPSFLMFSRDSDPKIIKAWQDAFSRLQKTDFFQKTARKWSKILDYELHYAPKTGFQIFRYKE